ncbi:hypothetical protein BofuT4_uP015990.1 [Botrytis cinerea T4]|uniref:Uncharacterized protein n=1 Tax=Botryotinia fuckeliana (strain T4) TaxID=999810 RepID=G2YHV6_BOTF4|nr:hypothetical protein BofuT4_uP015990.1 [Botrytis cinerea T4]
MSFMGVPETHKGSWTPRPMSVSQCLIGSSLITVRQLEVSNMVSAVASPVILPLFFENFDVPGIFYDRGTIK